jgi:hypothetical protein
MWLLGVVNAELLGIFVTLDEVKPVREILIQKMLILIATNVECSRSVIDVVAGVNITSMLNPHQKV